MTVPPQGLAVGGWLALQREEKGIKAARLTHFLVWDGKVKITGTLTRLVTLRPAPATFSAIFS